MTVPGKSESPRIMSVLDRKESDQRACWLPVLFRGLVTVPGKSESPKIMSVLDRKETVNMLLATCTLERTGDSTRKI